MKKIFVLIFFLLAGEIGYCQQAKKPAVFKTIKSFFVDLNNDNKMDTIILSTSLNEKGAFNRITILIAGFKKKVFKAKDSWGTIDNWFLDSNKNVLNSKVIFLKKTEKHTVIILSAGTDGAGYGGEFSIINIENDSINMVFDHNDDEIDVELPTKLIELENNGRLCFIFRYMGEVCGEKDDAIIETYHPFFVYPVDDSCRLNHRLTKAFNEKHYVFAGYKMDSKIKILLPLNKNITPSVLEK